jgi:hypothetical protein
MAVYLLDRVVACPQVREAAHPPALEAGCRWDLEAACPQGQAEGYPLDQEEASQQAQVGDYLLGPEVDCLPARVAAFPPVLGEGCLLDQHLTTATFLRGLFSFRNWRSEECTNMQSSSANICRTSNTPNHAMQPTAGRRTAPLHFMKAHQLQSTLGLASGG